MGGDQDSDQDSITWSWEGFQADEWVKAVFLIETSSVMSGMIPSWIALFLLDLLNHESEQ